MAVLKFITTGNGAQCAMTFGISTMPTWCVVSLVSPVHTPLLVGQPTVRDLILSGWTTSNAEEAKLQYLSALTVVGESKTALIARMRV